MRMNTKMTIEIVDGKLKGECFEFLEHDTFIFGRKRDCHASLPNDPKVSRHHFLLEINPPEARLRDLGSLNGTMVNGVKWGGRERGETVEEGAKRQYPEVDLKSGDVIQVGDTSMLIKPLQLKHCNLPIRSAKQWMKFTVSILSTRQ